MTDLTTKKVIIWDWNGTLLNDVGVCIDCMNRVLLTRSLPGLTIDRYREIFTFPVKEYYEKAGFDFEKEPFKKPALEFIAHYHDEMVNAPLHENVTSVLGLFQEKGYRQVVLSAMERDSLVNSLEAKGIINFFSDIAGISDHYAHSKVEVGKELVRKLAIPGPQLLIIGDSLHDLEVAEATGIDCLLVANGHQSKERLLARTPNVVEKIEDIIKILK